MKSTIIILVITAVANDPTLIKTRLDFNPNINRVEAEIVVRNAENGRLEDTIPVATRSPFRVEKNITYTGKALLSIEIEEIDAKNLENMEDKWLWYETVEPNLEKVPNSPFVHSIVKMKRRIDIMVDAVNRPRVDNLIRARNWLAEEDDFSKASNALDVTRTLAKLRGSLEEKAADYFWFGPRGFFDALGPRQRQGFLREYLDAFLHDFDFNRREQPAVEFGHWIHEDGSRKVDWENFLQVFQRAYPETPIVTNPNTDPATTTLVFEAIDQVLK